MTTALQRGTERGLGDPMVDTFVETCATELARAGSITDDLRELVGMRSRIQRPVDEADRLRFVQAFIRVTGGWLNDDQGAPDEQVAAGMSLEYLISSERIEVEYHTAQGRAIQAPADLHKLWKAQGRPYTAGDVSNEWQRYGLVLRRIQETEILARYGKLDPARTDPGAQHLREIAGMIADHRSGVGVASIGDRAGWTTAGAPKWRRLGLQPEHLPRLPDPSDQQINLMIEREQAMTADQILASFPRHGTPVEALYWHNHD